MTYDDTFTSESVAAEITSLVVSVAGVTGTDDFIVIRDAIVPGTDWADKIIGYGLYDGANFVFNYWGTKEEAAASDVYTVTYDYTKDVPEVFTLVAGATVTAQ